MRVARAVAVAAAFACASASTQTAPAKATGDQSGNARPAAPQPASQSATSSASPAAPMTAAEAAEKAHEAWIRSRGRGSGGDGPARPAPSAADDAPCTTSSDCTLTRISPDGCCATLCSPRAVTRASAADLDRRSAECQGCVEPLCRAPPRVDAQCRTGRCVAEPSASPD